MVLCFGLPRLSTHAGAQFFDDFLCCSKTRGHNWNAASEGFDERHGKILVALTREHQESGFLHSAQKFVTGDVAREADPPRRRLTALSLQIGEQGAVAIDSNRNRNARLTPGGNQRVRAFLWNKTVLQPRRSSAGKAIVSSTGRPSLDNGTHCSLRC